MSKPRGDEFFEEMLANFQLAQDALTDLHREALEDFRFRLGEGNQWDPQIKAQREADGRPCYEINRVPQFMRQVTGEQKKNRPAIQASPIGDGADVETAEIEQGLIRNIERQTNASEAYDTSFDHCATGGFGYFRLHADYVDGKSFEQEIQFVREPNPFAHYPDPRCKERDYSDAQFWFVVTEMLRSDYQKEFPKSELAGLTDFGSVMTQAPGWILRDSLRIAEYFYVETETKTLVQLRDGSTAYKDELKKGDKPARDPKTGEPMEREAEVKTVRWCKTNGVEILDETDIPGEFIPIVPVLGEELLVDGKRSLFGIVRYLRTPQQLYNLWQSAMAEAIALAPKSPYMATPVQTEGFEEIWDTQNTKSWPFLPVNPDPKAPGWPHREVVEPPIQAITVAIAHADQDLHTTTGIYPESLGESKHEQSGKAILLRQRQGNTATFGLQDAMSTAIKHAGRIIIGWIPFYYDSKRVVRVVNPDGTSKTVPINQPFQDDAGLNKVFDLSVGKYDVAVSSAPSHETMRQEAAENLLQLIQAEPSLIQVAGDLLVSMFDWPIAKELAERLKKMLPSQLQENGGQAPVPPAAQAQLAQQSQMIEQLTASVHKLANAAAAKLPELATRERIALINARAGILEAALKAQSQEAQMIFEKDIEHIDRQLAMMPDPGMQSVDNGSGDQGGQPSAPAAPASPGAPQAPTPASPGAPQAPTVAIHVNPLPKAA